MPSWDAEHGPLYSPYVESIAVSGPSGVARGPHGLLPLVVTGEQVDLHF